MPPTKRKEESVTVSDVFAVCKEIQANQTELSSKIHLVDQKLESIETIVHGVLVECNGADGEAAEKLNQILTARSLVPSQSAGGARVPGQHRARAGAAARRAARGCSEAEAAQRVHKWSPRESPAPARLLAPPARFTPTADAASTACRGLSSSPQAAPEFPTIQPPGARRRASSSTTRLRWASRERPPPGFHQTVEGVTPPPRPAAPRPALHLPTWRRLAPRCRVCVPFCLFLACRAAVARAARPRRAADGQPAPRSGLGPLGPLGPLSRAPHSLGAIHGLPPPAPAPPPPPLVARAQGPVSTARRAGRRWRDEPAGGSACRKRAARPQPAPRPLPGLSVAARSSCPSDFSDSRRGAPIDARATADRDGGAHGQRRLCAWRPWRRDTHAPGDCPGAVCV